MQVVENTFRSKFGGTASSERGYVTVAAAISDISGTPMKNGESDDEWQPELLE